MNLTMNRKIFNTILLCALCTLLISCSQTPSQVIGKEKMAHILVDIHKAEVIAETNSRAYTDSLKRVLRQSVYAKYGVTQEQVDSSLSWYGYNMKKYMDVYDRSIEILEKDLADARENAASSTAVSDINVTFDGDSVDVWTAERMRRFSTNMPSNIMTFTMTRDQYWEKGDAYTLRPKMVGFRGPVDVTMAVEYVDGSVNFVERQLNGDGWQSVTLLVDTLKDSRSVYGTIAYRPHLGETAFLDSIQLFRTRKAPHQNEYRSTQRFFKKK